MRQFAVRIVRFGRTLPLDGSAQAIAKLVKKGGILQGAELDWLIGENGELRAILFASVNTARLNQQAVSDNL